MANLKLSQLQDGITLDAGDLVLLSKGLASKSLTGTGLANSILNLTGVEANAEENTLSSEGSGESLVGFKVGSVLGVKSLTAGTGIELTGNLNDVEIKTASVTFMRAIRTVSASSHTLELIDNNTYLRLDDATAVSLVVPTNAAVSFPIGAEIHFEQTNTGTVTVSGTPTINHAGSSPATRARYSGCTLIQTATDVWTLHGDLVTT